MKGLKSIMEIIKIDMEDAKYPQRLLKVKNFPTEIYAIGNMDLLNSKFMVGIVGSRRCTEYGRRVANEFAKALSEKEICVVSGMAIGIDGISHNSAIEEKGKTIAVLGSGLKYIYPQENEWLFHKIIEKGGCIISEYPPDTEPDNKNYPIRNRIISGISDAVLVVEAIHRSGSTITAKYAKEEGKLVYAIPNTIYESTGVGTNRLLRGGAILVTDPMQIVQDLNQLYSREENSKNFINGKNAVKDSEVCESRRNKTRSKVKKLMINNDKKIKENNIIEKSRENKQVKKEQQESISMDNVTIKQIIPKEYVEVYRILTNEPVHINEIAKKMNKQVFEVTSIITMMEIEGYAYQPKTNYFSRNINTTI